MMFPWAFFTIFWERKDLREEETSINEKEGKGPSHTWENEKTHAFAHLRRPDGLKGRGNVGRSLLTVCRKEKSRRTHDRKGSTCPAIKIPISLSHKLKN